MKRWTSLALIANAIFFATAGSSLPQTKLVIGYLASNAWTAAFIAQDHGFFAKHEIDAELRLIALSPQVAPALLSASLNIGGMAGTEFLQATEQGLDLVAVAAGTVAPGPARSSGIVARAGSGVTKPTDLEGKKVAVPGFGAVIDLVAKKWLQSNGMDYHKVQWLELPFPQMADAMKSGVTDAAALLDPFYSRIVESRIGYDIGDYGAIIPAGTAPTIYVATRDWVGEHSAVVASFRRALDDAIDFSRDPANADAVRASIAKYTKLPTAAVTAQALPNLRAQLNGNSLRFWVDLVREQGLITTNPDPANLIAQ